MRVLLAHPPLNAAREVTPPLGLCTLAAWLNHQGHQVRVVDLDLEVKGHADGPGEYRRRMIRAVQEFSPEAVGITSMYNNSLQAEEMARIVKRCDSSVVTIGGGSHFGALGAAALRRIPELDFVIEGEGEPAFSRLLEVLAAGDPLSGVPRLHYRVQDDLRANAAGALMDLSHLPSIWSTIEDCIDLGRYARTASTNSPRRAIYIEAGRGCPFACSFCATAPFWERKYRVKPIETIIDEMRFLHELYGYDGFMLVHDLLTADKRFVDRFSESMIEARLPVEWMANHRTDINLHGLAPKMKAAGCWAMFFGVESGSARMQKEIRKGLKREGVVTTITSLSDLGIASTCSFIIGFPDETTEELSSTIAFGAELKLLGAGMMQFHRLRTWPPAPLSRLGLPALFDLDSLRIEYPFVDVPPEDIEAIEDDPEFFAGYFAPYSSAGSFAELAEVELFFTQAVAAAPLTVAVLGRLMGDTLIASFYETLSGRQPITRDDIEADPSSMLPIWSLLRPFMEAWIADHHSLTDWQRILLHGVMTYEEYRLRFVEGDGPRDEDVTARGLNWVAFISPVDVGAVFEAMHAGQALTGDLVQDTAVVFLRQASGTYAAFTTDVSRLDELERQPVLR